LPGRSDNRMPGKKIFVKEGLIQRSGMVKIRPIWNKNGKIGKG